MRRRKQEPAGSARDPWGWSDGHEDRGAGGKGAQQRETTSASEVQEVRNAVGFLERELAQARAERSEELNILRKEFEAQRVAMQAQMAQLYSMISAMTERMQGSGAPASPLQPVVTIAESQEEPKEATTGEAIVSDRGADPTPQSAEGTRTPRTPKNFWADATEQEQMERQQQRSDEEDTEVESAPMEISSAAQRAHAAVRERSATAERRAKKGRIVDHVTACGPKAKDKDS